VGVIKKQGIQNTIISYIGIIIGFVNILVLQPIMLLPEELGLVSLLSSFSIILAVLFPIGLNNLTVKFFPRFRNTENGHNGFLNLLFLIALISFAILGVGIFIFKGIVFERYSNAPLFIEYFYYIYPITFCQGFISIITIYSYCLFRTVVPSFINEVLSRVLTTVIVSLYFLHVVNFDWFMRLFMLSFALQLFLLAFYVLRIDKLSWKINWKFLRLQNLSEIRQYGLYLAFGSFAAMAMRNIDVIIIGAVGGVAALSSIAIYKIAFTIGTLIETPSNALIKIADSSISNAFAKGDMETIKTIYYQSVRYFTILGGGLFVGVAINITSALSLLRPEYREGGTVILIISVSAFFNMMTGINSSIIYYSDKYMQGTYLLVGLLIVSAVLNYLLVPLYGITGAAVATGSALFLFNLFKFLLIFHYHQFQPFGRFVLWVLIIIGICLAVNHFIPRLDMPVLDICFRSVIIVVIYIGGVLLTHILPEAKEYWARIRTR
jgi:O-antigen/teichoic acid export membrane protein